MMLMQLEKLYIPTWISIWTKAIGNNIKFFDMWLFWLNIYNYKKLLCCHLYENMTYDEVTKVDYKKWLHNTSTFMNVCVLAQKMSGVLLSKILRVVRIADTPGDFYFLFQHFTILIAWIFYISRCYPYN